uniref:Uncharacterized protein n=1 Tax=Lepeophtheirus salmonis TaxID=72036 RepID=A0A0K2VJ23_LEPSM
MISHVYILNLLLSFFRSLFFPLGTLSFSIMLNQEGYLVNLVWIIFHLKNISPGGYHVFIPLTLWSTTFYLLILNLLLFIYRDFAFFIFMPSIYRSALEKPIVCLMSIF